MWPHSSLIFIFTAVHPTINFRLNIVYFKIISQKETFNQDQMVSHGAKFAMDFQLVFQKFTVDTKNLKNLFLYFVISRPSTENGIVRGFSLG